MYTYISCFNTREHMPLNPKHVESANRLYEECARLARD